MPSNGGLPERQVGKELRKELALRNIHSMRNQTIDYKKVKSIHFLGIKGVGMTPVAIIAKEAGFIVTGCDTADIFITDEPLKKAGIQTTLNFSKEHLIDIDLVITTGAHGGFDNPEIKAAKELQIP